MAGLDGSYLGKRDFLCFVPFEKRLSELRQAVSSPCAFKPMEKIDSAQDFLDHRWAERGVRRRLEHVYLE